MTEPRVVAQTIQTPTHGRFLVRNAQASTHPVPLLIGFHGYMESAELQMDRLAAIPGTEGWCLVSVQGLHRFYRGRSEDVVASWMTRQDRELSIADNLSYVESVVASISAQVQATGPLVFAGFSQGVAMAFRAACATAHSLPAVVAMGGDLPSELDRSALSRLSCVLLGRGERDEWYTETKRAPDIARLREAGVPFEAPTVDAAHEWTGDFSRLAASFLERLA